MSQVRSKRHSRLVAVAAVAVVAAVAGCGSGSSSGAAGHSTSSTAAPAVLGQQNPAKGSPVTVGFMTDGGSGAIDAQSALVEQGARIAVSYVNDYRGGIAGRPLNLVVCGNKSTPAGAQACANQFIEKKVTAAIWPFTGQSSVIPMLVAAGIPVITFSGGSVEEMTTPGVFTLSGGFPGTLAAFALDVKNKGGHKFAMIVIDVPAATQALQILGKPLYKKAGIDLLQIAAPPGTPDLTAQLQKAVSEGADAVGVTGDLTFCTSFLKAYDTLGLKLPKYILSICNDPTVVKALPNALEGAREATVTAASGRDNDLYAAMIQKYAHDKGINPDPNRSSGVASGVSTVMDLIAGMKNFSGDVTPAAVRKQFETTQGELFMSDGLTFKCDGTAVSMLKSVCSVGALLAVLNADGTPKSTTKVEPGDLFKP